MLYRNGRPGRGRGICTVVLLLTTTHVLLRNVGLLKYYQEAISLMGHSGLLVHMIRQWDVHRKDFCVGLDQWYHSTEEDIYSNTGISRRGEYFPQFPYVPVGFSTESYLMYSHGYIGVNVLSPTNFQVSGG
jgi:hypothetical protein